MINKNNWKNYFQNGSDIILNAHNHRRGIEYTKLCKYGIDFLDDTLGGIHPNELILLGAESGMGKTHLVSDIIMNNINNNKTVLFFKLEGDRYEFGETLLWKLITSSYYSQTHREYIPNLDFTHYRLNNIPLVNKIEDNMINTAIHMMGNLFLYDNKQRLDIQGILAIIEGFLENYFADLIVIDHINYMSFYGGDSEYRQESEIMSTLKRVTELNDIPAIVVSHTRKKQRGDSGIPDKDDFIGSSDKFKISNTCIMLAPYFEEYDEKNRKYGTLFRIPKSRTGVSPIKLGIKTFDGIKKEYLEGYDIAKLNSKGCVEITENKRNLKINETRRIDIDG